jgi:hypothetical protein
MPDPSLSNVVELGNERNGLASGRPRILQHLLLELQLTRLDLLLSSVVELENERSGLASKSLRIWHHFPLLLPLRMLLEVCRWLIMPWHYFDVCVHTYRS